MEHGPFADVSDVSGGVYDYVVVGGGTAGCAVAARLSEDPDVSVALLEAAPSQLDDPVVSNPMGWLDQVITPGYDWLYETIPQPRVQGGSRVPFPRGRSLGGTSTLNFMGWCHPQREEIDNWETLGNEGWNWENLTKYAKKAQRFTPSLSHTGEFRDHYNPEAVGHDGPIPISFTRTASGIEVPWQKTLEKYGIDVSTDTMSGTIKGTSKCMSNIDPTTGKRVSAAHAYLLPNLHRANLTVLTEACVTRINISTDGRAESVAFDCNGKTQNVSIRREVIICAGVVKSPQILELSGIGDPKILGAFDIPVKVDLPGVGTNVQEHITHTVGMWKLKCQIGIVTSEMLKDDDFSSTLAKSLPGLDIPFTLTLNALTFVPLQTASPKAAEIIAKHKEAFEQKEMTYPPGLREQYRLQLKLLEDPESPDFEVIVFPFAFPEPPSEPHLPHVSILPTLARPFTRGTIHIESSDPMADPAIDPDYLAEQIDLDIMVEAYKFIKKVTETEPFSGIVVENVHPGPDPPRTEEEIRAFVKQWIWSSWHTIGSCSMLPREKGGVVDAKLKVYGTRNVRVADLSIAPLHFSVHPQATVYAIAEAAAEFIKADRRDGEFRPACSKVSVREERVS